MEQWIYARLYDSAFIIMREANDVFCAGKGIDLSEEDGYEVVSELNKLAFTIGSVLRKGAER